MILPRNFLWAQDAATLHDLTKTTDGRPAPPERHPPDIAQCPAPSVSAPLAAAQPALSPDDRLELRLVSASDPELISQEFDLYKKYQVED